MPVRIKHIAYHLPENVFTNEDFFKIFPHMQDNANLKKIGVEQRVIASEGETASDLALQAAEKLFNEYPVKREEIEFLLYSSIDTDYMFPATSAVLHKRLGLDYHCGTIDTTHGCSAYVYALSLAKGLMESNGFKKVLVLSANTISKILHPKDKASRYLFGDGAAATLLEATEEQGIGQCVFATESAGFKKIIKRDSRDRHPITEESYTEFSDEFGNTTSNAHFYMDGTGVFLFSIRRVPQIVTKTLARNNLTLDQIDLFIFHQANLYIIETIVKKMGIPEEKVFNNIQMIGNTVAPTIPIALSQAMAQGVAKPGQNIMLVGFGVGLSLAATVIRL